MKILFETVDTAHVHFFKHVVLRLQEQGHEVLITARQKDITVEILEKLKLPYQCISRRGKSSWGLACELLKRQARLYGIARRWKPDVMVAKNGGPAIGLVGFLLRIPRIVFEDTEHARLQRLFGLPLATKIVTGDGYLHDHGRRQIRYKGIWNQAYLNPDCFTPDPKILSQYGLSADQPYIVMRTLAWEAAHDLGFEGISTQSLQTAVEKLSPFGRVLICSETPLPASLEPYRNPLPHEHVHHLLTFAQLYLGEGGSMSSEAAILGTPSIFCNPLLHGCGCLLAMERDFQLMHCCKTLEEGLQMAVQWLEQKDLKQQWQEKARRYWARCDNLPDLMLQIIQQAAAKQT